MTFSFQKTDFQMNMICVGIVFNLTLEIFI